MGCDIHLYAEVLRERPDAAVWEPAHPAAKGRGYYKNDLRYPSPYDHRDYDVFAILADVRNGSGFAAINTGEGFAPIADARGFPDDLSAEYAKMRDQDDSDDDGDAVRLGWFGDHSHTYITLGDLLEFDWTQRTSRYGVLGLATYLHWYWEVGFAKKFDDDAVNVYPRDWCGAVMGKGIKTYTEEELWEILPSIFARVAGFPTGPQNDGGGEFLYNADRDIDKCLHRSAVDRINWPSGLADEFGQVNCRVEWQVTYAYVARHFWTEAVLPLLSLKAKDETILDARFIMGFDS